VRSSALVLLAIGIAAAGCGSSATKHHSASAEPAVPWTSAQPPQLAARAAVSRRCRAADLRLPDQGHFAPQLEGGIALVPLLNAGKHACRLTGRPRVRFVHAVPPRQVQKSIPSTATTFPEVPNPASSLLALRPGEVGAVTVSWDNWCDPQIKGKPRVPPKAIRVTLPDRGGSLETDYNAVPNCLDPSRPSTIGVSRFQPSPIAPGRRWTAASIRASIPDQPLRARRGGVLHFRVELKNVSQAPAGFSRCPSYIQQLAPAGRLEVYSLNCKAAHPIGPGKTVAFAMRLPVPRAAPLGHNGLFWLLDPFGQQGPEVNVRVNVRS
jgi:uncharacterized protein DUF4232